MPIEYRHGPSGASLAEVLGLYAASTLGEQRPLPDPARMQAMWANANLIVTAWDGERIAGLAWSLTDGVYCTCLSGLAVRLSHQRQDIGRELIRLTREAAPQAALILLAALKAADYYPRLGFKRHESAWVLGPGEPIRK